MKCTPIVFSITYCLTIGVRFKKGRKGRTLLFSINIHLVFYFKLAAIFCQIMLETCYRVSYNDDAEVL